MQLGVNTTSNIYIYKKSTIRRHYYFNIIICLWNTFPEIDLHNSLATIKMNYPNSSGTTFKGSLIQRAFIHTTCVTRALTAIMHLNLCETYLNIFLVSAAPKQMVLVCQHDSTHYISCSHAINCQCSYHVHIML